MQNLKDPTPEQTKEVAKVLSRARMNMVLATIKFALGIFTANFVTILVGKVLLGDADIKFILGYQAACVITNAIFMTVYYNGQIKSQSDIVSQQIKEILKK